MVKVIMWKSKSNFTFATAKQCTAVTKDQKESTKVTQKPHTSHDSKVSSPNDWKGKVVSEINHFQKASDSKDPSPALVVMPKLVSSSFAFRELEAYLTMITSTPGTPFPKGCVVHGPPGCGKTTMVQRIASNLGMGCVSFHPWQYASGAAMEHAVCRASMSVSIHNRRRILVVDVAELWAIREGTVQRGWNSFQSSASSFHDPVIILCSNLKMERIRSLQKTWKVIRVPAPSIGDMEQIQIQLGQRTQMASSCDPRALWLSTQVQNGQRVRAGESTASFDLFRSSKQLLTKSCSYEFAMSALHGDERIKGVLWTAGIRQYAKIEDLATDREEWSRNPFITSLNIATRPLGWAPTLEYPTMYRIRAKLKTQRELDQGILTKTMQDKLN